MQCPWQDLLSTLGAQCDIGTTIAHFGHRNAEWEALAHEAVVVPIDYYGFIKLSGEDTRPFLQGQLSSDVRQLDHNSQYSSYSTAKGRVLSTFLLIPQADNILLQLPQDLLPDISQRLSKFILRSKTRAIDASDAWITLGLAGPEAELVAIKAFTRIPKHTHQIEDFEAGLIVRLPQNRFQILVAPPAAIGLFTKLIHAGALPAGAPIWTLSDIRAGIPWVDRPIQENFIAQMLNLELLGAVGFDKGCYCGQEIIARTHYLGKVKRRMYRIQSDALTQCGDELFTSDSCSQMSGKVVSAAASGTHTWEALAVLQMTDQSTPLQNRQGQAVTLLDLPYRVDDKQYLTTSL